MTNPKLLLPPRPWPRRKAIRRQAKAIARRKPLRRGPSKRLRAYYALRARWLKANAKCETCETCRRYDRNTAAQDVHHRRGRTGSLLTDTRYFVAVCRSCHDWIHDNPQFAIALGWLAGPGKWGRPGP